MFTVINMMGIVSAGKLVVRVYSDDLFYVTGVNCILTEMFDENEYIINIYSERECFDMELCYGQPLVFAHVRNPFLCFYVSLCCYDNLFMGKGSIDDIRRFILAGKQIESKGGGIKRSLSIREREIVRCIMFGMTDDEMADEFNLSKKTISAHRRNILSKMGIKNRNELYKYLFELNKYRENTIFQSVSMDIDSSIS
ncbi:helix-turn-helix domain-containing protein [Escherichia coli]|uniref:helix-turn-helix domain-containing protein n=1 Tax=Escherichia coli TaxID=562 RepID=UPI0017F75F20|nr:helix-turn-helix transcriptional regulator [Escherichia coli]